MRRTLPLLLLAICGCKASSGDDGESTAGETGDTDLSLPTGLMEVTDLSTALPLDGVAVDVDGASFVTNTDGVAQFDLAPSTLFEFALSRDTHIGSRLLLASGPGYWTVRVSMVTPAAADGIVAALGRARDPALGIVAVSVDTPVGTADLPDFEPLVGATVTLDVAVGYSFVLDSTGGPVEGDTLVEGGRNFVVFVDVPPGDATFTLTPPNGEICVTLTEHDGLVRTLPAVAGEVSSTIVVCG